LHQRTNNNQDSADRLEMSNAIEENEALLT